MRRPRVRSLLCELSLLIFALSVVAPFPSTSSAQTRADGPEVVMGSTKRDFGDVLAGEELEQNFPVRNAGTKPLELSRRSALGTRSTAPDYPVAAAVWRPNDYVLTRTVAARRAAPT